jgi:hypothetical protein
MITYLSYFVYTYYEIRHTAYEDDARFQRRASGSGTHPNDNSTDLVVLVASPLANNHLIDSQHKFHGSER